MSTSGELPPIETRALTKPGAPPPVVARPVAQEPQLFAGFEGAATAPFDDKAREILGAPVDPRDVEIRPDGIVYMSGVWYRRQLIRAFGAGGWALLPRSQPRAMGDVIIYHGALIVLGRLVSEAFGECATRNGMTYASALEGARTDCLTRCCKDLGMATELWDKTWIAGWRKDCAHQAADKKWYKDDGSEHEQAPLFQGAAPAAGKATATPTTPPATSATGQGDGDTRQAAPAAKAPRADQALGLAKDYVPANKVPVAAGDPPVAAGQIQRIHVLVEQCLDDQTYRLSWLKPYRNHEGKSAESSKDLTFDQAANLIKRLTAHAQRQGERTERMKTEGPENLAAVVGPAPVKAAQKPRVLQDELQRVFSGDDDESVWLHGLFGVSHAKELDRDQSETALQLLLSWGTPLYDKAIETAQAMGKLR